MLNPASPDILFLATVPVRIYTFLHGWTLRNVPCKLAIFHSNRRPAPSPRALPTEVELAGKQGEAALLLALWWLACILTSPDVATHKVDDGKLKCR